jgi:hypothetical protein
MPFQLCTDYEPVILIELSGTLSDAELAAMSTEVTELLKLQQANRIRAAVVLDFSTASAIAPHQRRAIGEWRRDVRGLMSQVCVGMAMVVKTPLIRGVLTAIGWFSPEPVPVVYMSSLGDAINWSINACEKSGLSVPAQVIRRLKGIGWMRESEVKSPEPSESRVVGDRDSTKKRHAREIDVSTTRVTSVFRERKEIPNQGGNT